MQPRRAGRPGTSDAPQVQKRLVDAAERLFTKHGYAATSIRAVAESAGVNPALVSYYFGGKQALLGAVFERALEPLMHELQSLQETGVASPDVLLQLLHRIGREHPNLLPLLLREALLPSGEMHEAFVERFAPRLGGLFPELLRREQAAGRLARDADPEALGILILAMGIFPFVAAPMAQRVLGVDPAGEASERLLDQASQLINRGVQP